MRKFKDTLHLHDSKEKSSKIQTKTKLKNADSEEKISFSIARRPAGTLILPRPNAAADDGNHTVHVSLGVLWIKKHVFPFWVIIILSPPNFLFLNTLFDRRRINWEYAIVGETPFTLLFRSSHVFNQILSNVLL